MLTSQRPTARLRRRLPVWGVTALAVMAPFPLMAEAQDELLEIPWAWQAFSAEEGCSWQWPAAEFSLVRSNGGYLAPPAPGQDWTEWLAAMRRWREAVRAHAWDIQGRTILLSFDGVRAWVRTGRPWAFAGDLQPGETLVFMGRARALSGNHVLCLAFDWNDRTGGPGGGQLGWSAVVATAEIPADGDWHDFRIEVAVPDFDVRRAWARPILGMDGTYDPTPGQMELSNLSVLVPSTPVRVRAFDQVRTEHERPAAFDDSVYRRPDLEWVRRSFVTAFVFVYDRSFWDPDRQGYRVQEYLDEMTGEFGPLDAVLLWHAYPRLGVDDRNQFDFFAHLPGGLSGLRAVVDEFHARGVRVYLPYNPWDRGTRRDPRPDEVAMAETVAASDADGVFLDTLAAAPGGFRAAHDARRPGVAFESEGSPSVGELEQCSASWAQGLQPLPDIGVLLLKWIEPRHMQRQIRRWDASHHEELTAAWLNGGGVLIWENVFGTWNPWRAEDRATLRRMSALWHAWPDLYSTGEWLPCWPTLVRGVLASCWEGEGVRVWALANHSGVEVTEPVVEAEHRGDRWFDAWNGRPLDPELRGDRARLSVPLSDFGCIVALAPDQVTPAWEALLSAQRREAERPIPSPEEDQHTRALPVVEAFAPPAALGASPLPGMAAVPGGEATFTVRHMRRECGCYPDPGTRPEQWPGYLLGVPHDGFIEHRVTVTLGAFSVDLAPVTNREFARFLQATGYRPSCPDRFLEHWGGSACPPELLDQPVVYVDLDDARACARWFGSRLPTEWEWQRAAEYLGDRFLRCQCWEWTESQRDDGHTRFVLLRGGSWYQAGGSIWYFPGGPQPVTSHAKFIQLYPGLDRCATIGFRRVVPALAP